MDIFAASLRRLAKQIRSDVQAAKSAPQAPSSLTLTVSSTIEAATILAETLDLVADKVSEGSVDALIDVMQKRPTALNPDVASAPRRLRARNHVAGLYITNVVAGCWDALDLLSAVDNALVP